MLFLPFSEPGLPLGPWFHGCHGLTMSTQRAAQLPSDTNVRNSGHQKHQGQHQGEADVDLYGKKGNLCRRKYNKNNSSMH